MASYFVAHSASLDGVHAVHDRSRCPPACFPQDASEYLGEYGSASQAVTVARLVYGTASACACCDPLRHSAFPAATTLRS
jgi:hypothetical protein